MFVMTMKWNKKTALWIVIAAAVLLCGLVLAIAGGGGKDGGKGGGKGDIPSQSFKTNEDRVSFLESLGWEVEPTPLAEKKVVIPKEFSEVYTAYNKLQLEQGFDLSKYKGMEATLYTYAITNYTGYKGSVVADLYILGDRLIGGDIHALALDGFMHGLSRN
ncbi:MAG: DUF4830 domain-containing protein [Bacillota bacterium]